MDHLIVLNPESAPIAKGDWYGVHTKLYDFLGPRVTEAGETLWQFAMEPRTMSGEAERPEQFVLVRTNTPELGDRVGKIARYAYGEVEAPVAGTRVRLFLTASARPGLSGAARRRKQKVREEMRDPVWVAERKLAEKLIAAAGVAVDDGSLEFGKCRKFHIVHTRDQLTVPGLRISCTGVVQDADKLAASLKNGAGRDRGFGFGVVVIEPVEVN